MKKYFQNLSKNGKFVFWMDILCVGICLEYLVFKEYSVYPVLIIILKTISTTVLLVDSKKRLSKQVPHCPTKALLEHIYKSDQK